MIRIFVIAILCSAIPVISYAGNGDRELTMEEIFYTSSFNESRVSGINFLNNGDYSILERSFYGMPNIIQYDIVTGAIKDTIFRGKNLIAPDIKRQIKFSAYVLSSDESKILLATRRKQQYRRSFFAEYYIWDRDFQTLTLLTDKGLVQSPAFSPSGNKVSFVFDNNIYIKDLDNGQEFAVTSDGEKNNIINGKSDWVYEEEFLVVRMHKWSPDGKSLAYVKFNEKEVKEYVMRSYGSLYPETIKFKYPKAGEKNSDVSVHVFNVDSQTSLTVGLAGNSDRYIPRIRWTKDPNRLAILKMNRRQNELELLFADASTGKANTVLVEKNKSYIDVNDHWHFLDDNKHFLWVSEVSGYNHVYLYDMQGKLKKQITSGEWDVTNVYGFDEVNEQLYFQSAEVSPMERYLYKVGINGKDVVRLGNYIGWCKGIFNKTFEYFINTHTDINTPQRVTVNKVFDGLEVRVLEDNESINTLLEEYNITNPEFFKFKTSEGIDLNGFMIKPPDFNPRKKYPVLMWVYGGPTVQLVTNKWLGSKMLWLRYMASQGYIIACVDNRGTPARGESFRKSTYMKLGELETKDQIEAAQYLGGLSYVDKFRIGIWGWSFGGYMTALCLTKGAEIFKMGVSVAPVSNWRFYDTVYTERYLRTPQENPNGYDDNSPINFVKKLKGRLLLVHGMLDDNVHLQNSTEMVKALIEENKDFDVAFYPDKNHGIHGGVTSLHLFNKITNYIKDNL